MFQILKSDGDFGPCRSLLFTNALYKPRPHMSQMVGDVAKNKQFLFSVTGSSMVANNRR